MTNPKEQEYQKEYYQKNKKELLEYHKKYSRTSRGKKLRNKWLKDNNESVAEYNKAYQKKYSAEKRKKLNEYSREYNQRPEVRAKRLEAQRKYRERENGSMS